MGKIRTPVLCLETKSLLPIYLEKKGAIQLDNQYQLSWNNYNNINKNNMEILSTGVLKNEKSAELLIPYSKYIGIS